ncbi:M23 family peptidase [Streptomyces armeniacus]|uniref:M23 family peptidase n=1 Tax=Streptomyces armeniacus TaxID=83291 RepID=A0A345XP42_9ACTN|nr:M23 family metallopeptidase [Streptomyces armeniacus]AXK33408.1 M23 family peptidase [Streptomyces armeniacus]
MAFTRATGRHRRPTRANRTSANLAGIAGLATVGVMSSFASPAGAAASGQPQVQDTADTGLTQTVVLGDSLADSLTEQASSQSSAAEQAAAEAQAKARAKAAAEAKKKAEAEARKKAAEKAEKAREAEEQRAARAAEAKRAAISGYVSPIEGSYVSTPYGAGGGMWSSGTHTGVDFHASSGTSVRSVAAGEVVEAGWGGAYGNNVVVKHSDGTYTQYGHLSSVEVSVGQSVTSGEQIGLSGNTGNSNGPHLHFEARSGPDYGSDIDPVSYLRQHGVSL